MAKRKRDGETTSKPSKKVVLDVPSATAAVSSVLHPKSCPPVIATTPGINVPKTIPFRSYVPQDDLVSKAKSGKRSTQRELLLHSTAHSNLDYTAKEETQRGSKPLQNHYIGVYDPKTGKMEVIEAKKMVVRGAVRAKHQAEDEAAAKKIAQTMFERKAELGQIFGTKKAKKAIQDTTLNAISPQKKPGADTTPSQIGAASRAMLNSVGEITSNMASREQLQADVDDAKPVPKANLEATEIYDVYDPKILIGRDVLNLVPVREWQEKAKHGDNIQVSSRYVASRVFDIARNPEATDRLRVLRYYYFVLLFYLSTSPGREKGTRRILQREKLVELLDPAPEAVVENIRRKFSESGTMRKFHTDLVLTYCCAFACIVDNFEVDTQNLKDDLRIDQKSINQYFHEIGGKVKPSKKDGRTVHMGKLTLPLDFPKQRHLAPKRR